MKTRKNELDVDFLGGVGPLTKDEEKRISEVIKMGKSKKSPQVNVGHLTNISNNNEG